MRRRDGCRQVPDAAAWATAASQAAASVLLGKASPSTANTSGSKIRSSRGALRVAVHRLRQRYRQVLREEIGHTVERADEVDSELADLRRVLSEHG